MSSEELNRLSNEITEMGAAWYRYVGLDHHKDRDCHFMVEAIWSYGDPPKFRAYHEGYVGERFYGTDRKTMLESVRDLHQFMLGELRHAHKSATSSLANLQDWGYSKAEIDSILELTAKYV